MVVRAKVERREELAQRLEEGAEVTVLPSQASRKGKVVTEQMKREYLSGWYEGAEGCSFNMLGSEEFRRGWRDGQRYRYRKAHGLERYAGPRWMKALERIKARPGAPGKLALHP